MLNVPLIDSDQQYKNFKSYLQLYYRKNFINKSIQELKNKSILLELNMSLPRNELEKIFSDFLDLNHKNIKNINFKKSKNKVKKLVDMLFLYDGKKLNISNEDLRRDVYEDFDREMHPKTFREYIDKMIDVIDNDGYKEIAEGKKSIFEI